MVGAHMAEDRFDIEPEVAYKAALVLARTDAATPCGLAEVLEVLSIKEAAREYYNFLRES